MTIKAQKLVTIVTIFCLVLIINSIFFYNLFRLFQGGNFVPTFRNVNGGGDQMVYFSLIRQAAEGKNVLLNLYTNEVQVGFISPLWWFVGKLVAVTKMNIPVMYNLLTMLCAAVLLTAVYRLSRGLFDKFWERILVLPIVALGSGLGVFYISRILFPVNGIPVSEKVLMSTIISADLWFAEGFGFMSLRHSPLFVLSQLCLLLLFWWVAEKIEYAKYWQALCVGAGVFLLTIVHPYDAVILALFVFVHGLIFWIEKEKLVNWLKVVPMGVGVLLGLAYFFYLKNIDPSFLGWSLQNVTRTPYPLSFVAGYFWLLIPAIYGCVLAWRNKNKRAQWLCVWLVTSVFLIYFPSQVQRRFGNGIYIPMGVLACYGWVYFLRKRSWNIKLILNSIYLTSMSAIFLLMIFLNIGIIKNNKQLTVISSNEIHGLEIYNKLSKPNDVLLAFRDFGNIVPAYVAKRVYIGHGHQTVDWPEKKLFTDWFYRENGQEETKYKEVKRRGIDYIWLGPVEKGVDLQELKNNKLFNLIYSNDKVKIYKVE